MTFEETYIELLNNEGVFSRSMGALGLAGALATSSLQGAQPPKRSSTPKAPIKNLPAEFIQALNHVEASGKKANVPRGDRGLARGPFQIHKDYWIDAVRYDPTLAQDGKGNPRTWDDVENYEYAKRVVISYMNRYGYKFIGNSVPASNIDMLSKIHHLGGVYALRNPEFADPYVAKVIKALKLNNKT